MEGDTETPGRSRSITWLLAIFIGLPIFYFFSAGPVALLIDKNPKLQTAPVINTARMIYAPLVWLDRNSSFHYVFESYLNLWGAR